MLESIELFDQMLFEAINQDWANWMFDAVLPILREKTTWIPLYLFLLIFLPYRYGRNGFYLILLVAAAVGLSDFISSSIVKPVVERLRPCKNLEIADQVRLLVRCGSGKSFTSSHAANHFALAVSLMWPFAERRRVLYVLALFWAASISYAQVYVGVHYPFDVLFGAVLGSCLGGIFGIIARERLALVSSAGNGSGS